MQDLHERKRILEGGKTEDRDLCRGKERETGKKLRNGGRGVDGGRKNSTGKEKKEKILWILGEPKWR